MQNLAGFKHATKVVEEELTRCGINIIDVPYEHGSEVPSQVMGKLGDFTFVRAWYYYVVSGKVSLEVAKKLYDNPVGKTDIRVNGNCGWPPPEEQATYEDYLGFTLVRKGEIEEGKKYLSKVGDKNTYMREFYEKWLPTVKCIDDVPPDSRKGYVDLYHIDTELGLYIFVQTLKEEKLIGKTDRCDTIRETPNRSFVEL